MGRFSAGASEFLRRVVYPPFVSLWGKLRDLTGRQRRRRSADQATAQATSEAADKRRHLDLWKESHDR